MNYHNRLRIILHKCNIGTICNLPPHKFLVHFQVLTLVLKAPAYVPTLSSLVPSAPATLIWTLIYQTQGLCICCSCDHNMASSLILTVVTVWVNSVLSLLNASLNTAPMAIWHITFFSLSYVSLTGKQVPEGGRIQSVSCSAVVGAVS